MYECICGNIFDEPIKVWDWELRGFQDRCPKCGDWVFEKMDKTDMDGEEND